MSNRNVIHQVPKGLDPQLTKFLNSLREEVQIKGGKGRGNPLDRAITYRDLQQQAGATSLSALKPILSSGSDGVLYGDDVPFKPTGVEVLPTFTTVLVKWNRVPNQWYKTTEIFRVTALLNTDDPANPYPYLDDGGVSRAPVFSDAVQVASTISPFFTDSIPSGTTVVYWVRHVNRDNQAGPVHDTQGSWCTTMRTPLEVLEEYSSDIYQSEAYAWLRSELGVIDSLNRAMAGAGFNSGLSDLLANASSVDDLLAEQALSAALDKYTQRSEIKAQFSKNFARLSSGIHAAVNTDEAYVQRISVLESQWENDLDNVINSKITDYDLSLTSPTGAIATQINALSVSYDGVDVSLDRLAEVVASNDTKHARWGVKTDVNGKRGGVVFDNDGFMTQFLVDSDVFAITNGSSSLVPFVVRNDKVVMKEALIDHAAIYTLIAANITAERVSASISIESPVINGGSITGTTLNVNNKTFINANGFLRALDAHFEGYIKATSGELNNVVINDTCVIRGTLSAQNINGDVVDRSVVVVTSGYDVGPSQRHVLISGEIEPGEIGGTQNRILVVSGISLDHQGGGGSTSNFDVYLYLNGSQQQHFNSHNVEEEGSVTPQLGCLVPASTSTQTFSVVLVPQVNDNVRVQQSAIVADVFKRGSTFKKVKGLYDENAGSSSGVNALG